MQVITYDPYPDQGFADKNGVELVDLATLAKRSDVLSIHCPASDASRGIVDKEFFAQMKQTAILINTARGPIVNESDLVEALRSGAS